MTHSATRTLRCERCNGSFAAELAAQLTCPYCGHHQEVGELHTELQDYQRNVEEQRMGAEVNLHRGAEADILTGYSHRRLYLVLGAVILTGFAGAVVLGLEGRGDVDAHLIEVLKVLLVLPVFAAMCFFFWPLFKAMFLKSSRLTPDTAAAVCPTCGGPASLQHGEAVGACAYCSASLIPSQKVMRSAVDTVQQTNRVARMQRLRKERHLNASQSRGAGIAVYVFSGVAALLLVPNLIGMSISGDYAIPLLVPFAVASICLTFPVVVWVRRRNRKRAWEGALADVADEFRNGELHEDLKEMVTWLNTYWPGEFDARSLYRSVSGVAMSVCAHGFHTLIIVDPTDHIRQAGLNRRIEILFSAAIPGLEGDRNGASLSLPETGVAVRDRLASEGYRVEVSEAGLRLRATAYKLTQLLPHPALAGQELASALDALVRLAQSARAEPGMAIP